jgi:hypothetical protein
MHDVDRTQPLIESDIDGSEMEGTDFEEPGQGEGPFDPATEMELTSNFLEIGDEQELDQFLGDLIKKAGRSVGKFVKSPAGQALTGILKSAASQALPVLGGAVGTAFGGPAGGMIGSQLASSAGGLFGLELEGLSPEDREWEVARQFVKFAGDAAAKAAQAPPTASPQTVARSAAVSAARKHAPGLLRPTNGAAMNGAAMAAAEGARRTGRWVRRGRHIVLLGV